MSSVLGVSIDSSSLEVSKHSARRTRRGIRLAALRVPLVFKLVGANVALVALLIALAAYEHVSITPLVLGLAAIAVLGNAVAVLVALHPIRELESVARRVWRGDYAARV